MLQKEMKKIVDNYIKSYNLFDIDGMLLHMHEDVLFQNISNGEINMSTNGITELRTVAEQAKGIFKSRCQAVENYQFSEDATTVEIDYFGEFAVDIPDGPKAGDKINLKGKSEFLFKDGLIIELRDIS